MAENSAAGLSAQPDTPDLDSARRTLATERAGLDAIATALEGDLALPFANALTAIRAAKGRVIVSGMGKSGHVSRKVAATLASTGTPSFFVHPAEASHGDLGMVTTDDIVLAFTWSGGTPELANLVDYAKRWEIPLIVVTSVGSADIARQSDILLTLPRAQEACPHGLAPTTSTVMQLALGDALAVALLEGRGFTRESYHSLHPGGRLGADLNRVSKIMHVGPSMPLAKVGSPMTEALVKITEKGLGCLGIIDDAGELVGIITDGDLRRHLGPGLLELNVDEVMTRTPRTVAPDTLVGAALDLLNKTRITALFVVENKRPVGIVHMHDLLRIGAA